MTSKSIYFVLLVVVFSLVIEHADAGWKFWKKKKDKPRTVAPRVSGDTLVTAVNPQNPVTNSRSGKTPEKSPATEHASWKFWKKKKDKPRTVAPRVSGDTLVTAVNPQNPVTNSRSGKTPEKSPATEHASWKFWKKKKDKPTTVAPRVSGDSLVTAVNPQNPVTNSRSGKTPEKSPATEYASWKFWKKKKDKPTTVAPRVSGDTLVTAVNPQNPVTNSRSGKTPGKSPATEHADAGWKFWKKKKDKPTTIAPRVSGDPLVTAVNLQNPVTNSRSGKTSVNSPANSPATGNNNSPPPSANVGNKNSRGGSTPGSSSIGTRGAIAGAAIPGLAVGVGNSGQNIRNNAQPQRPNPGTKVGLDISPSRPARPGTGGTSGETSGGTSGQGYRDWAVHLTGAGEGTRQLPKVPGQGPALTGNGGQQQTGGTRPGSPVSVPGGQSPNSNNRQNLSTPGPRPRSPSSPQRTGQQPSGQSSGQGSKPVAVPNPINSNPQPSGTSGGSQVSTLHVGSLNPGQNRPGTPSSGYGSPGSPTSGGSSSVPASPTGGKSWAQIAGNGGNAKPNSPTPAPRLRSRQPGKTSAGGGNSGQTRPGQLSTGTGIGSRTGAIAAGAAAAGKKVYSSNPKYSKGNSVTDEDLEKLAEALFIKDTNNANKYITLNLQKQTTGSNPADQAPQPLLTVNSAALRIPTIDKVIKIYDNYKLDSRVREFISPAQRKEESLLVDTFLSTNVMSAAMRFLADKGFIPKDYYEYKHTLRELWFNLYSRGGDGKIGSAGFEHVFLTELKLGTKVSGLHNWIYFNAEEVAKRADYLGYIKKVDLGDKAAIVKIHAKYNNIDKPVTTMFIGTSPELEMALYTVCFFARPEVPCPVSLGGTKFNIITHKFRYRGRDLIGSAYPDI